MLPLPDFDAVLAAAARIAPHAHATPVLASRSLDELAGAHLQVDVAQRMDRAVRGLERQTEIADIDDHVARHGSPQIGPGGGNARQPRVAVRRHSHVPLWHEAARRNQPRNRLWSRSRSRYG